MGLSKHQVYMYNVLYSMTEVKKDSFLCHFFPRLFLRGIKLLNFTIIIVVINNCSNLFKLYSKINIHEKLNINFWCNLTSKSGEIITIILIFPGKSIVTWIFNYLMLFIRYQIVLLLHLVLLLCFFSMVPNRKHWWKNPLYFLPFIIDIYYNAS